MTAALIVVIGLAVLGLLIAAVLLLANMNSSRRRAKKRTVSSEGSPGSMMPGTDAGLSFLSSGLPGDGQNGC